MLKRLLLTLLLLTSALAPVQAQQVSLYPASGASLSVSNTSSRVALPNTAPAATSIWLMNIGAVEAFYDFGNSAVVATTAAASIPGGQCQALDTGKQTYLAAITAASTTTLRIIQGTGQPGGACGLASGGGAVTNAGTFAVQNTAATPAGANIIGKVGIDQTTPGTTNGVQVNAALPAGTNVIGTVGGTDDRLSATPTVQNAAYASGNNIGGLVTLALPRTASGILNAISIKFVGGATTAITAYFFDANPTGSTFTDKSTFTLATADLDKLILSPIVLAPAVQGIGSAITFAEATNLARMFKSTANIYCAFVSGGTFTPATTTDMHISASYDLNAN